MSNNYIEELVDIAVYPVVSERAGKQNEVTIGDLHGNGLKFLYFLIREGILDMPKQGYEQFYEIYKKEPDQITITDIVMLNLNLTLATVNPNPPKVRIIGDELFDRGSNDYFVLKLFEKLGEKQIPLEILASNHGIEYLTAAEKNLPEITTDTALYLAGGTPFRRSYANLISLKNKFGSELGDLMELTNKYYKPNLKLLSYTLDEESNSITLYTHAPVFIDTIAEVAVKFSEIVESDIREVRGAIEIAQFTFDTAADEEKEKLEKKLMVLKSHLEKLQNISFEPATSAKGLAAMIDNINAVFAYHVETNRTADLFSQDTANDPVFRMIWNRYEERFEYNFSDDLGYTALCVHGHDGQGGLVAGTENFVVNLDNVLGKDSPHQINTKGSYTILSTTPAMQLQEQLSDETLSEEESNEDLTENEFSEEDTDDNTNDVTETPVVTIYLAGVQTMPYLRDIITENITINDFIMEHKEVRNFQIEDNVIILLRDNIPLFKIYDDHICLMNTATQDGALQQLLPVLVELLTAIAKDHNKDEEIVFVRAQTVELKDTLENILCDKGHIVELDNVEKDLHQSQTKLQEIQVNNLDAPLSRPPPPGPISVK